MEISHRITFKRSDTFCDDTTISSSALLSSDTGGIALFCQEGCSGTVGSMSFYCTDYGTTDNWSTGGRSYNYTFASGVTHFEAL